MENIEQFKAKAQTEYQIRPPFKAKFRPAEARATIESLIPDLVRQYQQRSKPAAAPERNSADSDGNEDDEEGENNRIAN